MKLEEFDKSTDLEKMSTEELYEYMDNLVNLMTDQIIEAELLYQFDQSLHRLSEIINKSNERIENS